MKSVVYTYPGGFPFDQRTASDMQSATFELVKAFASFLGLPEVGNFIITGCVVVGADITPGYVYMDGDLIKFSGVIGFATTKIKKIVTAQNAPFEDGSNNPVYISTTAVSDGGGIEIAEFIRVPLYQALTWGNLSGIPAGLVIDLLYVHTDNNFTNAMAIKLANIEAFAEVNVQANWSETNPANDSFIQNKPILPNILKISDFVGISDLDGGENYLVPFATVGTNNYIVVGSLVANNPATWGANNNVIWAITNKQPTSFNLIMREVSGSSQALKFDYMLIQMP